MNNQPLVSIIIPTYRRWHLLCDAIESVFQQTYPYWEIVVVNDDPCSNPQGRVTDLLRDPRIIFVTHELNKGLAAARNTGISRSSGAYLAYLDDDDIYYPDHLETLLIPLMRNSWHVAYSDAYEGSYEDENSEKRLVCKKQVYRGPFEMQKLWETNCIPVLSVIHHRECLGKAGLFDTELPVLEDWDFWLRMSCHYNFHYIPSITSEYRIWRSKENLSQNTSEDKWNSTRLHMYQKYIQTPAIISDKHIMKMLRRAIYRLIRKKSLWVADNLKTPGHKSMLKEVLRHVTVRGWICLLFKKHLSVFKWAWLLRQVYKQ